MEAMVHLVRMELLAFCRQARIDAVQFFVNTWYGTCYMDTGKRTVPAMRT